MAEAVGVGWFEQVCLMLQSSPHTAEASAALQEFRDRPEAFMVAKQVLETSQVAVAQFHACAIIQHCLLARWDSSSINERMDVRGFLATLVANSATRERFVCLSLMSCLCVLYKRGWASEPQQPKDTLLHWITTLPLELGSRTLTSLVTEFSSKKGASIGLSLEFHNEAHAAFEAYGLTRSLKIAFEMLSNTYAELSHTHPIVTDEQVTCVFSVVQLCAEIFSWEFGPADSTRFLTATNLVIPSTPEWRGFLFKRELWSSVFALYEYLRSYMQHVFTKTRTPGEDASMVRASVTDELSVARKALRGIRELLEQLASVSGNVFESEGQRAEYVCTITDGTVDLSLRPIHQILDASLARELGDVIDEIRGEEALGLIQVLNRLINTYRVGALSAMGGGAVFQRLLTALSTVTISTATEMAEMADAAVQSHTHASGTMDLWETWRGDLCTVCLEGWEAVLNDPLFLHAHDDVEVNDSASHIRQHLQPMTTEVFRRMFDCVLHIALCEAIVENDDEEDFENEDIAASALSETMRSVCTIGRLGLGSALMHIHTHMTNAEGCVARLQSLAHTPYVSATDGGVPTQITALLEDVRVSIRFITHLLCETEVKSGETGCIPVAVLDVYACDETRSHIPALIAQVSHTVLSVLKAQQDRISHIHAQVHSQTHAHGPVYLGDDIIASPLLAYTVLWFAENYIRLYTNIDQRIYSVDISSLQAHTQSSESVLSFVCECVYTHLHVWPSQDNVIEAGADLLCTLAYKYTNTHTIVNCEGFQKILQCLTSDDTTLSRLTPLGRISFVKGVCVCIVHAQHTHMYNAFASFVQDRTKSVCALVASYTGSQDLTTRILFACDILRGLGQITSTSSAHTMAAAEIFDVCAPPLVRVCAQYFELTQTVEVVRGILEVVSDYCSFQLTLLSLDSTTCLYSVCEEVLKLFVHATGAGRPKDLVEDEVAEQITCVCQMLSSLANKTLLDMGDSDTYTHTPPSISANEAEVRCGRVVCGGVEALLPVLTPTILNDPTVLSQVLGVCAFVVQEFPDTLSEGQPQTCTQLMQVLLYGVGQSDGVIGRQCLVSLYSVWTYHHNTSLEGGYGLSRQLTSSEPFDGCVQTLLDTLTHTHTLTHVHDRIEASADLLLVLMAVDRQRFLQVVSSFIMQHPDSLHERLGSAFESLISHVPVRPDDAIDISKPGLYACINGEG